MPQVRRAAALALACLATGALSTACQEAAAGSHPVTAPGPPISPTSPASSAATVVPVAADFPPPVVRPTAGPPEQPRKRLPDGTRRLLPGHRIVGFYGAAGAPVLGILGTAGPEALWPRLARAARPFRSPHRRVLPAYELITFVANGSRGGEGNYSTRISDATIARYARVAKRHDALLILDIQPGRGSFRADARSLRRWLRLPYVGLALDPEWKLYGGQRPLQHIGHVYASEVNAVSRWLNRLTIRERLPQKLFLVHEFTDDMVRHKGRVAERSHLATVFNVDGFGGRAAKIGRYRAFADERRTPLGFKLFYDADVDILSPREVLRLHPAPVVVEYQ
jgi:hypothetical protein